jgi:hypothetical protein
MWKRPIQSNFSQSKNQLESLLAQFVKQYLVKYELFTPAADATKCLIFDDTDLSKTGKTIEGISKIHNHVSKTFYFGFKLLVAGYWNGSVFIPVDFSLHRESKTSKLKYGLRAKQRKAQKKTPRCSKTVAAKRYLALKKRFEAYETLGELFRGFKEDMLEMTLLQKLWQILYIVFNSCLATLNICWDSFMSNMINNQEQIQTQIEKTLYSSGRTA